MEQIHFHLYESFLSRSEALDTYCKRQSLSQEKFNEQRWDENFIHQEITKLGGKNIKKVWVCGPPVMNETFDRVFSA